MNSEGQGIVFPWLAHTWKQLDNMRKAQKLPHAVLLKGVEGIGKAVFAERFARALLCSSGEVAPCGECKSCQLFFAATHPDFLSVAPEDKGKAIKISQIRELTIFLSQTAQQGGRKVVLISPADAMNVSATNALLKSLEEPQGETILILVTSQPSRLLATVRSRCHQVALPTPSREEALSWLKAKVGDEAGPLLDATYGAPLRAEQAFRENWLDIWGDIQAVFSGCLEGQIAVPAASKQLLEYQPPQIVEAILVWLESKIRAEVSGTSVTTSDALNGIPQQLLFDMRTQILETKRLLLSGANPNPQLALEDLMIDWGQQVNSYKMRTHKKARPL
ncbi:DNA polymerase III subunit delta' [Aurantivibrio plasticivorans]